MYESICPNCGEGVEGAFDPTNCPKITGEY